MTAVALFCRILLGHTTDNSPILEQHADLLLRKVPERAPEGLTCDMYYRCWLSGSGGKRDLERI